MKKPRLLLLLHEMSLTGAPKLILDAFEAMGDAYEIRILAAGGGPHVERFRRLGRVTMLPPIITGDSRLRRGLRAAIRIAVSPVSVMLRLWRPDVIYVNSVAALPIASLLALPKAPSLLHVHELFSEIASRMTNCPDFLTRWTDHYIAVSRATAHVLTDSFRIDPERIALIHGFVPDSYAEQRRRVLPAGVDAPFIVGGAGKPSWRKGTQLWLQMARELLDIMGPDAVRFEWVGIGGDADSLAFVRMCGKLGLDDYVEFISVTPKPMPHYARFDVFAMTSWEDPFPLVVLENMVLGNPVVCFADGGGSAEAIAEPSMTIPEFSPRAMAEAIAELAHSPEQRAKLGESMRQRVLQNFTAGIQAKKIHAEIERVRTMAAGNGKDR